MNPVSLRHSPGIYTELNVSFQCAEILRLLDALRLGEREREGLKHAGQSADSEKCGRASAGRDTTERDFEGLGAGGARVGARRAGVRRPRTDAGGCGGPTPAAGFAARGLARVRGGPGRPPRGLGAAGERQRRTRCATRGRAPHGPGHTHTARVTSRLAWNATDGPDESIMDPSES